MLYATWSEGYRPGGINRNPFAGDYRIGLPDQLRDRLEDALRGRPPAVQRRRSSSRNGTTSRSPSRAATASRRWTTARSAEIQGVEVAARLAADRQPPHRRGARVLRQRAEGGLLRYGLDDSTTTATGMLIDRRAPVTMHRPERLPLTPDFKGNLIARYMFPTGRLRCVHAGRARLPDERRVDAQRRGQRAPTATSRRARSSTWPSASENDKYTVELFLSNATDEDAPLSVNSECTPAGLRRPAVRRACAGRARSASASRRTSEARGPPRHSVRGATKAPLLFHTFESGNEALRRFM